jgi:hypothetical protein
MNLDGSVMAVTIILQLMSLNLLGRTEKTHGNFLSEYLVLWVIFKRENSEYEATLEI